MSRQGYKHSKETKEKIRQINLGKKLSEEIKKKISKKLIGRKFSEEHKRKMSDALKGKRPWNKGLLGYKKRPHSEETKRKISLSRRGQPSSRKGTKISEENRIKLSNSHKGKKHSEETKRKMSESHRGEKAYQWLGGKSFEPYSIDWTDDLRDSIRKRDNYMCQLCGIHQDELNGFYKQLDVHHVDYNKDNLDPNNLISLCRSCHTKTNHNRDYWTKHL